jgi:Na+/melibiose symporter-like transporter
MGFDQNEYSDLKASMENFDPASYAQSNVVAGVKWMFIVIPLLLLVICLFFAARNKINKRRFDAVLKAIDELKKNGNINALSEQETEDVLLAAGTEKEKLWGGQINHAEGV